MISAPRETDSRRRRNPSGSVPGSRQRPDPDAHSRCALRATAARGSSGGGNLVPCAAPGARSSAGRTSVFGTEGRRFESCRACQTDPPRMAENRRFGAICDVAGGQCAMQCAIGLVTTWHDLAQRGTTGEAASLGRLACLVGPARTSMARVRLARRSGGPLSPHVGRLWAPMVGWGQVGGGAPRRPAGGRQAVAAPSAASAACFDSAKRRGTGNLPGSSRNRSSSPSSP